MPRISEFFGIMIYMYWFDEQRHKKPHFHARYSGKEAVFKLDGTCLEGDLGSRANYLIKEWSKERKNEIQSAWNLAKNGKELPWIKPLN